MLSRSFWILAMSLVMVSFMTLSIMAEARINLMSTTELKARMSDPETVVVDVRTQGDWKVSDRKIKGAVRMAVHDTNDLLKQYSKTKTLIFYCA